MWELYLAYSEAGFRSGYLDVYQWTFARRGPVNDAAILVVSGASALALAVVHSVTFVIGRKLGRYNVVDTAWGLGFVGGRGRRRYTRPRRPDAPVAAAGAGVDLGSAAELAHLPQDGR